MKKGFQLFEKDLKRCILPVSAAAAVLAFMQLVFGTICPMQLLFHIPCPGCGLTRACLCILTLRFREAWALNATAFLWIPLILFLLVRRYKSAGSCDCENIHDGISEAHTSQHSIPWHHMPWEPPVIVVSLLTVAHYFIKILN